MPGIKVKYVNKGCVFGSGAFGTALAMVLAQKCETVDVWHMNQGEADAINKAGENTLFLKGVPLAKNIRYSADAKACIEKARIVLFVIPTQFLRGFLTSHKDILEKVMFNPNVYVVMCSKGIEKSSLQFPGQILQDVFPKLPMCVLAGPSFAAEVARGIFTNVVIASHDINEARKVMRIMTTENGTFRCWASTDVVGCEVSSALKNVLAISSGICKGLGLGLNARAALISRGLIEIRDVTLALGGTGEAVFGLAGLGDLLLTCSSELSRNFSVGLRIGRGESLEQIMKTSKAVAEGVATARPLVTLAGSKKVTIPICELVDSVLQSKFSAQEAYKMLATAPLFDEGLPALPHQQGVSKL